MRTVARQPAVRSPLRPSRAAALLALLAALAAACVHAQESGARSQPLPRPFAEPGGMPGGVGLDAGNYPLSSGDVVKIVVYREDSLSGSYMIGPTGALSMTWARVQAAGLTVDQLRDAIVEQLRTMIKHPVVQVAIDAERSVRRVQVGGQVEKQGLYELPFGAGAAQAVLSAGITPESDLRAVRVTRVGQPPLTLDLSWIRGGTGGAPQAQDALRQGDVLYVPRLKAEFSVVGLVSKPGTYRIEPDAMADMNVLRALNAAGGPAEGASLANSRLLRADGTSEALDLHALLFKGDMTQNKRIASGDVLVIGEAGKITVAGQVVTPGVIAAREPISLLEALSRAGGIGPRADLKRVSVFGPGGTQQLDLERLWWQGDLSQNVTLAPGQTLFVPERDPEEILVVGAVEKPGMVDAYHVKNLTALRVVQAAEPRLSADLSRVTVHRTGVAGPLAADLRAVIDQGDLTKNVALQAGDMVFVPELKKVYAIGAFVNSGVYPVTKNLMLTELVARAGSFRPDALPKKMYLARTTPGNPQPQVTVIDFTRVERGEDPQTYPLQEGDVVYVPSRKGGASLWSVFRDVIWTGVGLFRLF